KPADEIGDRTAAHRHQARTIRLCGRRLDRRRHAGALLRDAARAERHPGMGGLQAMSIPLTYRSPTTASPVTRLGLPLPGIGFIPLVLVFPLVTVFANALADGFGVARNALEDPDALSSIRLTLIVAAIAVPANAMFGIAAAWAVTKFDFWGKSFLSTLIDLP